MASYYKRKNGTYCVRVSNGLVGGRQQLVSATYRPMPGMSKASMMNDLREFSKRFEKAVYDGVYLPGVKRQTVYPYFTEMPLEHFIREAYYPKIQMKLSPNTVRFYHKVCEQFLIPSFGHLRLCDITYHNLQAFIDFLAYQTERKDKKHEKGLAPGTVKRYATVFQSVMSEACRAGYLEENPLRHDSITYPKMGKSRLDVYSPEEVKAFCLALQGESQMTRLLLLTPIVLGLRRAEIVALKWSDIDFRENSISVTRSAYKVEGEKQGLKPPKSLHGIRKVFFPAGYDDELRAWKAEQAQMRARAGDKWDEQDFIFTTENGDMISLYTPTRICERFEEKHGLRHLKLHGLRHTCASLMMLLGADAETVRDVLGHDSVRTTDIYLHPYEDGKKRAAGLVGSVIGEVFRETENIACDGRENA